jgi:hypothetical protein
MQDAWLSEFFLFEMGKKTVVQTPLTQINLFTIINLCNANDPMVFQPRDQMETMRLPVEQMVEIQRGGSPHDRFEPVSRQTAWVVRSHLQDSGSYSSQLRNVSSQNESGGC